MKSSRGVSAGSFWLLIIIPDLSRKLRQAVRSLLHWYPVDLAFKVDHHDGLHLRNFWFQLFWCQMTLPVGQLVVAEPAKVMECDSNHPKRPWIYPGGAYLMMMASQQHREPLVAVAVHTGRDTQ